MRTAYKKVSSHGSINIPAAMRRELAIEAKDPMVVEGGTAHVWHSQHEAGKTDRGP